jgi:hypothetical protein
MPLDMSSFIYVDEYGTLNAAFSRKDFKNDAIAAAFTDANNSNKISVKIQITALLLNSEISGPGADDPANIPKAQFQIDLVSDAAVEECALHSFGFVDTIESGAVREPLLTLQIAQQEDAKASLTIPMRSVDNSNDNCPLETRVEF